MKIRLYNIRIYFLASEILFLVNEGMSWIEYDTKIEIINTKFFFGQTEISW